MPAVIDFRMLLVGSKGTMYADCSHNLTSQKYTMDKADWPNMLVDIDIHGLPRGLAAESIRHFARCMIDGTEPMVTREDGLANTRILAAIHESAEQGQPVDLS